MTTESGAWPGGGFDPDSETKRDAEQAACEHHWEAYWDGSLGYRATDCCVHCGAYRPTPAAEVGSDAWFSARASAGYFEDTDAE